jgi:hypothetical protein
VLHFDVQTIARMFPGASAAIGDRDVADQYLSAARIVVTSMVGEAVDEMFSVVITDEKLTPEPLDAARDVPIFTHRAKLIALSADDWQRLAYNAFLREHRKYIDEFVRVSTD